MARACCSWCDTARRRCSSPSSSSRWIGGRSPTSYSGSDRDCRWRWSSGTFAARSISAAGSRPAWASSLLPSPSAIRSARLARRILSHSIQRSSGFDPAQKLLFEKIASIAILVAAFFVGVDILGIDLTALAFFGGALGLAVGFGMQKTVGNLIAGIILLWDRSIKPGDVIEVGESFGWVNKIGVRAVSIITRDGKEHLIPNEILMTEEVVNWSYSSLEVRVHIEVGVSYNCDIKLAQELMREAAIESPRVLASPKPLVWLVEFGDSAVMFDIRCWIKDPEGGVGNMRADVLMRIWDKFKEHGIEIPFPQRDVHVKNWPAQSPPEPDARPMGEPEAAEEPEIESTKNTAEPAAKDS
ncbi:MAG: mechanosensitive ion channel [Sphingomonadales bacterium]|nr:mechanosensitive ion channel [Sphingomonadales bacterium]